MIQVYSLGSLLAAAVNLLVLLIFVEVIMSWIIQAGSLSAYHPAVRTIRKIVDPILNPIRRVLPPRMTGGWDLSPFIACIVLQTLAGFLYRL